MVELDRFSDSVYGRRMLGYYPNVIRAIKEFQAIVSAEYPEIEDLHGCQEEVLNDAYLTTMGAERIKEWEKCLNITPLSNSTLENRRDTIIARIRGQGKLNTALINSIVNAFTGGTANSYIQDSVLYVEITPPPDNKQYQFADVAQELLKKVPAHLGLHVERKYGSWNDIKDFGTWQDIKDDLGTWSEVLIYVKPTTMSLGR